MPRGYFDSHFDLRVQDGRDIGTRWYSYSHSCGHGMKYLLQLAGYMSLNSFFFSHLQVVMGP
jgi:hypothetical protein